jgi:carbamoyltransferase
LIISFFYDKPILKFERLLETYLSIVPNGFKSFRKAIPIWMKEKLFLKSLLTKEFKKLDKKFSHKKLLFNEHHESHASSAFYPSPFEKAIILTMDGVGEWATSTIAIGDQNKIEIKKEINFPHSLGLLYSSFTYYLGFKVNSGEYKVMGLAPYGKPVYKDLILNNLIDLKKDGSFRLNQKYFNYMGGLTMTNKNFVKLFKMPVRKPEKETLTQFHMDMASSIQFVTEKILLRIIKFIKKEYKLENLCMAGGVALNCVANGKILESGIFKNIWIQPAAGDAGGALGAAMSVWHNYLNNARVPKSNLIDKMNGTFLGPEYTESEVKNFLLKKRIPFNEYNEKDLLINTAKILSDGNAVGWFQGRMEFGPRSLGSRSILADPTSEKMQKNLNLKVKFRESFRPFAPAIIFDDLSDWFELKIKSPYMLFVSKLLKSKKLMLNEEEKKLFGLDLLNIKRSVVPAITHVDYSARIQTVHKSINRKFYDLLLNFKSITKCPILVNTSFNVRGEPIVCSPEDAYNCFLGTDLDYLIINNFIIDKKNFKKNDLINYKDKYELD